MRSTPVEKEQCKLVADQLNLKELASVPPARFSHAKRQPRSPAHCDSGRREWRSVGVTGVFVLEQDGNTACALVDRCVSTLWPSCSPVHRSNNAPRRLQKNF